MVGERTLHVFYSDYEEWWVAESAAHATELAATASSMKPGELGVPLPDEWDALPDDGVKSILEEDGKTRRTMTCGEWAVANGPGILAAIEH